MLLEINDQKSLQALQQEFSRHYPFLKIMFFDKPHGALETSGDKRRLSARLLVGDVRSRHHNGTLEINPLHTAWHIEKLFKDRYGLYMQVYRRNEKGWIQTSGSDFLTLREHNEIGRAAVENGHSREKEEFLEEEY